MIIKAIRVPRQLAFLTLFLLGIIVLGARVSHARPPTQAKLAAYTETLPGSVVDVDMVPIQGGTINIGGKTVTVKPFYIAKTDTAWEAYDVFLGSGPSSKPYDQSDFGPDAIARPSKSYILPDLGWGHNGYPAINVSFTSVTMYCRWMASVTKKKYRLPTEAEWEFACRAGAAGPLKLDKPALDAQAWYADNSNGTTHPIAKKAANAYGLLDMLGNVGNWATDMDGKPVLCGASYLDAVADFTSERRQRWSPKWQASDPQVPKSRWWLADGSFCGFRVVCEP